MNTWKTRSEEGRKRAILIDEDTRSWLIEDGKLVFDSTSVSQVYHAVMTQLGSIPASPTYGSRVHEPWKMTTTMPREFEASVRASVQPLVDSGVIEGGSIDVEFTPGSHGYGMLDLQWKDGGGQRRSIAIPIQPGIRD